MMKITNKPEISAIYYALLQSNYDFYTLDKEKNLIDKIAEYRKENSFFNIPFFSQVKQSTCEVYPYWPRAFTLELATFYICKNTWTYKDFNSYKQKLMNYTNISDIERNEAFWEWVKDFPSILHQVMDSHDFKTYLKWEELWINQQNIL